MEKLTKDHLFVLWNEKYFCADSAEQKPTTQQIVDAMTECYNLAVENVAAGFVSGTRDRILEEKIK